MQWRRRVLRFGPLIGYGGASVLLWRWAAAPLRALGAWLPFSLGLLCGLALAVVCGTAWVFLAGPLQEWILERCFDPPQPQFSAVPDRPPGRPQGVLVSDLHIDTWGMTGEESSRTEREARFLSLLEAVKASPTVDSFYLNGDLMDIPPRPDPDTPDRLTLNLSGALGHEQGVLLRRYNSVLRALLTLTVPDAPTLPPARPVRRAVFQTGNHDVGVSGLRYVQPRMPAFLPAVQTVWNPSLLIQTAADGREYPAWVYAEHGHHWDPLLWLYLRYSVMDTLRYGHRRGEAQLLAGFQRRGRQGMGTQTLKGEDLPPAPPPGTLAHHFAGDQPGLLSSLVRLRYRQAARKTLREFRLRAGGPAEFGRVRTLTVGHTHHPDRYVFPGGGVYVNSGDWSGATRHCAYCVLEDDGTLRGPFQWESAAEAEFETAAAASLG